MKVGCAQNSIFESVEEFERLWKREGELAEVMMKEHKTFILLVPGKSRLNTKVLHGAIILSRWGLQMTSIRDGQPLLSTSIRPIQAVIAFTKEFPNESFVDAVKKGYNDLFR